MRNKFIPGFDQGWVSNEKVACEDLLADPKRIGDRDGAGVSALIYHEHGWRSSLRPQDAIEAAVAGESLRRNSDGEIVVGS